MAGSSVPRSSELELLLEPRRGELVRAFVREASLAEDAPASVASLVAGDAADIWQALCTPGSGRERVRIVTLAVRGEIKVRILLPGIPASPISRRRSPDSPGVMAASPGTNAASMDGRSASIAA